MQHRTAGSPAPVIERSESLPIDRRPPTREEIRRKNQIAIAMLDELLLMGDAEEQAESWAYLKQALDEDRPEGQKLFP